MDNIQINLYIGSSIRGPRKGDGRYLWILEYDASKGPVTLQGFGALEDTTENQLTLTAINKALARITKSACVRVFTSTEHVFNSVQNGHVRTWQEYGWYNAKGKAIKNSELWKEFVDIVDKKGLGITITKEPHSYSEWMTTELKKGKSYGKKHHTA